MCVFMHANVRACISLYVPVEADSIWKDDALTVNSMQYLDANNGGGRKGARRQASSNIPYLCWQLSRCVVIVDTEAELLAVKSAVAIAINERKQAVDLLAVKIQMKRSIVHPTITPRVHRT